MSSVQGADQNITNSQDTLNTNFNKESKNTSSCNTSLNESQDFHLVDMDDSQDISNNKVTNSESLADANNLSLTTVVEPESFIDNCVIESKISIIQNEEHNISSDKTSKKVSENDVQCTAPSNEISIAKKRKGVTSEEPPNKLQKLSLYFDLSKINKEEHEVSQSDEDQEKVTNNCNKENVIIEETQDTLIDESIKDPPMDIIEETQDTLSTENPKNSPEEHENDKDISNKMDVSNNDDKNLLSEDTVVPSKSNEIADSNKSLSNENLNKSIESTKLLCKLTDNTDKNLNDKQEPLNKVKLSNDETNNIDKNNKVKEKSMSIKDSVSENININADVKVDLKQNDLNKKIPDSYKPRMSIEVIYEGIKNAEKEQKKKSKELVEIDEEGEKIVLDSSQEETEASKIDKSVTETPVNTTKSNSSSEYLSAKSTISNHGLIKTSTNVLNNPSSDSTNSNEAPLLCSDKSLNDKDDKNIISISKDNENSEMLSISENEVNLSSAGEENKVSINVPSKPIRIEKEINVLVRLKCLFHVDENTKDFVDKELTSVQCVSPNDLSVPHKSNDGSLADISSNDKKDCSPGSVNSNPQVFALNSRLSFASTISSSSSASSAASLAAKLAAKDMNFYVPRGPAKQAKKVIDGLQLADKVHDESIERLNKEWKNSQLLTTTILNYVNAELAVTDLYNSTHEKFDEALQKIRSSTPESAQKTQLTFTPKNTKKEKSQRRSKSKTAQVRKKSGTSQVLSNESKVSNYKEPANDILEDSTPKESTPNDDYLIGKEVFAKWADNNYYPGKVTDRLKTKYKVKFYDGESKLLIEEFIIPMPKVINKGLSVYALTKHNDFGICGIISDVEVDNEKVYYFVETDEHERLKVKIKDIFLSHDQAQILKEEVNNETKTVPSSPKCWNQFSLDNVVEGKRRSKRIASPAFSTPKSRRPTKSLLLSQPSSSGLTPKVTKEEIHEDQSSDSTLSIKDDPLLSSGIQEEVFSTPNEATVKGPRNRIKGKPRSKKKSKESNETINLLGPIPPEGSSIFKGMSFILTCASLETLDRYLLASKDSSSEAGTENEEQWLQKPFIRDRLEEQITAGGGKVYDSFDMIPKDEYKNTKLITNLPNHTVKSLLCLSVGIPAYNHGWVIRCCQENKIINPAENELPSGWSLEKQSYVEIYQRSSKKPLMHYIILIPQLQSDVNFAPFWRQICENAGAVVLIVENAESMEGFVENTVIVSNIRCPTWALQKANDMQIPIVSTTWVIQCLVEGRICLYDALPYYRYDYIRT